MMISLSSCRVIHKDIKHHDDGTILIIAKNYLDKAKLHNNMMRKLLQLFKTKNIFSYNSIEDMYKNYDIVRKLMDMSLNICITVHDNIVSLYTTIMGTYSLYNEYYVDTDHEKKLSIMKLRCYYYMMSGYDYLREIYKKCDIAYNLLRIRECIYDVSALYAHIDVERYHNCCSCCEFVLFNNYRQLHINTIIKDLLVYFSNYISNQMLIHL